MTATFIHLVFFFGGGWNGGTPSLLRPQATYLAERGMVAIAGGLPGNITPLDAGQQGPGEEKLKKLRLRLGAEPESMPSYYHVHPEQSPTIIFHGENDTTVPNQTAELFTEAMTAAGNRCELVDYPNQEHGFFNAHRSDDTAYKDTLRRMDDFPVSLGWLDRP